MSIPTVEDLLALGGGAVGGAVEFEGVGGGCHTGFAGGGAEGEFVGLPLEVVGFAALPLPMSGGGLGLDAIAMALNPRQLTAHKLLKFVPLHRIRSREGDPPIQGMHLEVEVLNRFARDADA